MSDKKITAGLAALKVMEGWGIDTMYGIPSGTLSGLMNAMSNPESTKKLEVWQLPCNTSLAVRWRLLSDLVALVPRT